MLREVLAALSILGAIVAFAPAAPALPADCSLALAAEESLQNDAETGDDASDSALSPTRILYDDYYWGYLSTVDAGAPDAEDWYVFHVPPGADVVMANVIVSAPVVPNEHYAPDHAQRFFLTLRAPGGEERTVDSEGGQARFVDPAPGDHLIRLWTQAHAIEPAPCVGDAADLGSPETPVARNHGLYIGCDPVCAEAPPRVSFAII